ncbi:hypothetical protein [Erwinia amylovora]|uniref:hypothetical protein n=1 Tax=Erwinia amylovora TaxID=552 RepID=UPI0014445A5B|nr:hypothetical protein [Erwinia amylovora]
MDIHFAGQYATVSVNLCLLYAGIKQGLILLLPEAASLDEIKTNLTQIKGHAAEDITFVSTGAQWIGSQVKKIKSR